MKLKPESPLMTTLERPNSSSYQIAKKASNHPRTSKHSRLALSLVVLSMATLSGCTTIGPNYSEPTAQQLKVKDQWQVPLANTNNAVAMNQWWGSFNDLLLLELITSAQANNPTISAALARIEGARNALRIAANSGQPNANASSSLQRQSALGSPTITAAQIGVDAGWELDLFGAVKRTSNSAQAQLESSQADFHASRLSLASEVANIYIALKTCEANVQVQQVDVTSQVKTLDLTQLKVKAGFSAPADASLLRASLANSRNQLTNLQGECSLLINTLGLVTGLDNQSIQEKSLTNPGKLPKPALFAVNSLPAQLIEMRPDIRSLERLLAASSEQIGIAQANQYPRVTLSGNIGLGSSRVMGATTDGLSWGFGPAISLPLFDGGRRAAAVDSAKARFNETQALVQMKLQSAVSEVQEAMIRLNAAQAREANALNAVADFEAFYKAAETRWSVGVGSLLELEEARRLAASAKVALLRLEQERITQLISLYKALGGGWDQQLVVSSIAK
jgi:outer membrane protein, multidrug efflux system